MNKDVIYSLDEDLRKDIIKVKNLILSKLEKPKIFLFGSIAKGNYSKYSDIDLLVLIPSNKSIKELRSLRHELEDYIEDLNIERDVDIKVYNASRYEELCLEPCFEKDILKDLIDIRSW
ncbi:nucleotidyltransferase family protein [Haloimpatiens lingqiaonensis]|uniref:nucleotidyltransferase family protein n=1 Tax=Haloimpatiens lingqiaonensis TaxID=1380675 RepID=UPI0010FDDAD5|nr:nucleotidyltransferase domain-containing protein [Haloimpatiens lingqiaonensis]